MTSTPRRRAGESEHRRRARERRLERDQFAFSGHMAGSLAHELRTPLSVISNAVYLLNLIHKDADSETRKYLDAIDIEVQNSTQIVSQLLSFYGTEAPNRSSVSVFELVSKALVRDPPPERIVVNLGVSPDLPAVFVDPRQIGQALSNILNNAYQAMPKHGTLRVSAELRRHRVVLGVTDTGRGIPAGLQKRLFEPFFTTKARGIGLGLVIARHLAELNDARIAVRSEEGKGSTFALVLPTDGQAGPV